jgi:hypothetical protein
MLMWGLRVGVKTGRVIKAKKNGTVNGGSPIKKELVLDEDERYFSGGMGEMSMEEDGSDEI